VQFEGVSTGRRPSACAGWSSRPRRSRRGGKLWVHELVGATVLRRRRHRAGHGRAVEANPASDLLVLESGGLIPLRFVTARDAAAHTGDVDIPEGLLDL
jgi:hypothetical protein